MSERDSSPVRIPNAAREQISRLRLRLSSEVMSNISLGNTIALLVSLGEQEYEKLVTLAKKEFKEK